MVRACEGMWRSGLGRGIGSGWRRSLADRQQRPEACLAGADHPGHGRGLRHGGDHAPGRGVEALCLALAATLHGSGGRRAAARQDPQARQGAGRPSRSVARLVERTLAAPPGETTHWTSRAMAAVTGLAISTVQKIWRAHGLEPHRLRTFKLSRDPEFAAKVRDVVGLYVDPPAHAVVLSVDEKSQIQALDRTHRRGRDPLQSAPPPGRR